MSPTHRKRLLAIMANIEQQIAEAESLIKEVSEDEIVLRASKQLYFRLSSRSLDVEMIWRGTSLALAPNKPADGCNNWRHWRRNVSW